jgi:hypothetical protein
MKIEIKLKRFLKSRKNKKIISFALTLLVMAGAYGATRAVIINFGWIGTINVGSSKMKIDEQPKLATEEKLKASSNAQSQESFSYNFTYLKPGETVPQFDPAQLSLTSRNPVTRIYNKAAKLGQLQRELNGLAPLPLIQARPMSMQLQCPPSVSEDDVLKKIEGDLDENLVRLEKMLADNPA